MPRDLNFNHPLIIKLMCLPISHLTLITDMPVRYAVALGGRTHPTVEHQHKQKEEKHWGHQTRRRLHTKAFLANIKLLIIQANNYDLHM